MSTSQGLSMWGTVLRLLPLRPPVAPPSPRPSSTPKVTPSPPTPSARPSPPDPSASRPPIPSLLDIPTRIPPLMTLRTGPTPWLWMPWGLRVRRRRGVRRSWPRMNTTEASTQTPSPESHIPTCPSVTADVAGPRRSRPSRIPVPVKKSNPQHPADPLAVQPPPVWKSEEIVPVVAQIGITSVAAPVPQPRPVNEDTCPQPRPVTAYSTATPASDVCPLPRKSITEEEALRQPGFANSCTYMASCGCYGCFLMQQGWGYIYPARRYVPPRA